MDDVARRDPGRTPLAAQRQAGAFTREQARAEGWSAAQVKHRLRTGAWTRLAGSAVGARGTSPTGWTGVWAVHLTWPDAVASHFTAAAAHGLPVPPGPAHAIAASVRSLRDLVVHRVALPIEDVLALDGGPLLTTARRSALDCLRVLPPDEGERLLVRCLTRQVLTREDLRDAVACGFGRHGTPALLHLLRRTAGDAFSAAERLLHSALRREGVTGWAANVAVAVAGRTSAVVDLLFEKERVVVEVDGWSTHGDRESFERDRRRQNALVNAGYVVLRFTWRDLQDRPAEVVAQIRTAVARRRS